MSHQNMTIAQAIQLIEHDELFLPAIQRSFVWSPARIQNYLDSLLRGYPTGVFLFWNTKARVQFRRFDNDRTQDLRHSYHIKDQDRRGIMVLDGQQRLQSLYVAIKGTYDGQQLFFDILGSGQNAQSTTQARYRFTFLSTETAEDRNEKQAGSQYWIPFRAIYNCKSLDDQIDMVDDLQHKVQVDQTSAAGKRIRRNLNTAFSKMKLEDVLSYYTIDPAYGEDTSATPVEEILEIFVRINSGGQVLGRSDLMFSLLRLKWEGAGETIDSLVDDINHNHHGSFKFDNDFALRCTLVCLDKGASYDINKLRNKATIQQLEAEFPRVARALVATVDFLAGDARILDQGILGSSNTLIPFVYFFYHQDKQRLQGEGPRRDMKVALYLALMTRVFARHTNSRVDGVIREVFRPALSLNHGAFPLDEFRAFVNRREGRGRFDNWLLQRNKHLLMNILNRGTMLPKGGRHRPEYDHIFPQSRLRAQGYSNEQINNFANLRLISKPDNIWKSNIDPQPYFTEHPGVAAEYLMRTDLLSYEDYPDFLVVRREKIWEQIVSFLGLQGSEYHNESRLPLGYENEAIDELEKRLRDFIDEKMSANVDADYWKSSIPGDILAAVKGRINEQIKKHPGLTHGDFITARSKLDFCDMSDYQKIIATKNNWPIFDNYFHSPYEFERHMSAVVRFRNGIKHNREVHQVDRLTGEAGIIWLNEALGSKKPIVAPQISDAGSPDQQPQGAQERWTVEDCYRLLTRRPVPNGQKALYNTLIIAGAEGRTRDELVAHMGRRDRSDLGGVLGALGNRVNHNPGYGNTHKPGMGVVLIIERTAGEERFYLTSEMADALRKLGPDWLKLG